MKALVYTGTHMSEIRDVDVPVAGDNQVLVDLAFCGICGSDMHAWHGHDERRVPPLVLGHEAVGIVQTGPLAGKRVAINPLMTCGDCDYCNRGDEHLCPSRELIGMRVPGAFAEKLAIDAGNLTPLVTWGTSPEDVISIDGNIPNLEDIKDDSKRSAVKRSLDYMNLIPGSPIKGVPIDRVFIGSCTNGRIEDLREAASILPGKKVSERVSAMVVPGSGLVKEQAEEEGLDKIFIEAGFEWREPGCSMCLAMNADKLSPKERCASTSNRNFEGRQGREGRTHLVSPKMAAAAALAGCLTDVREMVL